MQRGNLAAPPQTHKRRVHLAQAGTQTCVISLVSSCDVSAGAGGPHVMWKRVTFDGVPGVSLTSGRGPVCVGWLRVSFCYIHNSLVTSQTWVLMDLGMFAVTSTALITASCCCQVGTAACCRANRHFYYSGHKTSKSPLGMLWRRVRSDGFWVVGHSFTFFSAQDIKLATAETPFCCAIISAQDVIRTRRQRRFFQ